MSGFKNITPHQCNYLKATNEQVSKTNSSNKKNQVTYNINYNDGYNNMNNKIKNKNTSCSVKPVRASDHHFQSLVLEQDVNVLN